MALNINLLANRDVELDATLLGTLDQTAVLHSKRAIRHIFTTKAITYGMDMTKLPKNTQPKTTSFNNWCNTTEEILDQET